MLFDDMAKFPALGHVAATVKADAIPKGIGRCTSAAIESQPIMESFGGRAFGSKTLSKQGASICIDKSHVARLTV